MPLRDRAGERDRCSIVFRTLLARTSAASLDHDRREGDSACEL
jgi:hypothetical protein